MALSDMLRTAVLVMPLLLLAMTGNWWGVSPLKSVLNYVWAPFILTVVVQFGLGLPVYWRVLGKLLRLRVEADMLVVVGASAAFALALWQYRHLAVATDTGQLLIIWRDLAFGASLVAIVLLGEIAQNNAQKLAVRPRSVVPKGPLVIEPGAFIPYDGVVQDGASEIQDPVGADDVFPIVAKAGMRVNAGARNGDGALTIQPLESVPGHAHKFLERSRPNSLHGIVNWAARIMLVAAIAMSVWRLSRNLPGPGGLDAQAVADALQFLAMAAPLGIGLVLAAPASELLNAARRLGIEIRDIGILDRLRHVGAVVMGHRGVLVPDRLRVISAQCVDGISGSELIRRVSAVAQLGHDPWGTAVLDFAVNYRMRLDTAVEYKSSLGEGITARIDSQQILFGTRAYLESRGVSCQHFDEMAKQAISQGRRLRWVGETFPSRRAIGFVVFGAPTVSGAAEAVKNLRRVGLSTAWLARTDDPAHVALAKHLKIGRVISELPSDVVEGLGNLRKKSGPILLVTADVVPEGLAEGDVLLPFGRRIMEQLPGSALATARHDPRLIVDLFSLAARHRQVVLINTVIAFAAAVLFAFLPERLGSRSDLASYEVAIVLLLAMSSLGLRAVPTTANEVDEE